MASSCSFLELPCVGRPVPLVCPTSVPEGMDNCSVFCSGNRAVPKPTGQNSQHVLGLILNFVIPLYIPLRSGLKI